jgi:hypothetical protein
MTLRLLSRLPPLAACTLLLSLAACKSDAHHGHDAGTDASTGHPHAGSGGGHPEHDAGDAGEGKLDASMITDASKTNPDGSYPCNGGPVDDAGECLMGKPNISATAEQCQECGREVVDCQADPGCLEIQNCAARTGCVASDCYFFDLDCMAVIDKWGATSISTTLGLQVGYCIYLAAGRPRDIADCHVKVPDGGWPDDAGTLDAGN